MNPNFRARRKPQEIYWWTLGLWVIAVACHLAWFVVEGTSPQTDETYARGLVFQAVAFAFFRLPYWLGGLIAVLVLEFAIFGKKDR